MNNSLNEYLRFNIELNHFLARLNVKMNNQNVSATPTSLGNFSSSLPPQSTVWSYLVDLLQALQHLHEHNHIHMDIKPENIFIGRDGICKVGDFGLMLDLAAADAKKQAMEGDSR